MSFTLSCLLIPFVVCVFAASLRLFSQFHFHRKSLSFVPLNRNGGWTKRKRESERERGEKCANFAGCANYEVTVMTVSQPARDFN